MELEPTPMGEIVHFPRRDPEPSHRSVTIAPESWLAWLLAALAVAALLSGCASEPSPALPDARPVVDALALRVERLEARRDLAAWCHTGCLSGVRSVKVTRSGIECRCVPLESLGRVPLREIDRKTATREGR